MNHALAGLPLSTRIFRARGASSPETQTIRRAAGCHPRFSERHVIVSPNHAIRRVVTEAPGTRQRLHLMRDP
jgi:hypothetical protein